MPTIPQSGMATPTMAKGGSGPAARAGGAATFRLVEGATLTLPDGSTATVRQGELQLTDGQRLPLPEAGGSITIERRVARPDGRTALVRHTIRVGETIGPKSAADQVQLAEEPQRKPTADQPGPADEPEDKQVTDQLGPAKKPEHKPVTDQVQLAEEPEDKPVTDQLGPAKEPEHKPVTDQLESANRTSAEEPGCESPDMSEEAPQKTSTNIPDEAANGSLPKAVDEVLDKVQDGVFEAGTQDDAPADVSAEGLPTTREAVPTEVQNETPKETSAALRLETQADVPEEVPADAPSEAPAETTRTEVPSGVPVEVPEEVQMEEPVGVPREVNTEKPLETSVEVSDNVSIEERADVSADNDVTSSEVAASANKAALASAALGTPLLSSNPECGDELSSVPGDAQPSAPAAERNGLSESCCEELRPTDILIPTEEPAPSTSEQPLSPKSAAKGSLSPVTEDAEPSFESTSVNLLAGGQPYCEWTENESYEGPWKSNAPSVSSGPAHEPLTHKQHAVMASVKEEEESDDEEPEPVINSRLAHHDSLRLPVHVPRLRKRTDGENIAADTHSPCGRKVAAHLNDPQKRSEEDKEMRTKLNSILHKLGYGVPDNTADSASDSIPKDPGGVEEVRPQSPVTPTRVVTEGPEEPEPVSVPKVISFFESITPQRVESPDERRKWRSNDRSPSALRSPRSARSPEPLREPGSSQRKQSPTPRRVNFADSAQRVFIGSTEEADEMESIPIPRHEDSNSPSPELVQTCLKEVDPVITRQPTRLTTILVQNAPDSTPEDSKAADETVGALTAVEASPRSTESSESPQIDPLSSSVVENEEVAPPVPTGSLAPATVDSTSPDKPEHDESVKVKKCEMNSNEEVPEQGDVVDFLETEPLITPSSAKNLDRSPAAEVSADGGAVPVQAEPLPRPSSVTIQADLPLRNFPTPRTEDATELPDGIGPAQLTADGPEETVSAGPGDPFLPQGTPASSKSTTWFEECMMVCCCCWVP